MARDMIPVVANTTARIRDRDQTMRRTRPRPDDQPGMLDSNGRRGGLDRKSPSGQDPSGGAVAVPVAMITPHLRWISLSANVFRGNNIEQAD
jgi:hypothetical protein